MILGEGRGTLHLEKQKIAPYVTKNSLDIRRDLEYNIFVLILCKMIGYFGGFLQIKDPRERILSPQKWRLDS